MSLCLSDRTDSIGETKRFHEIAAPKFCFYMVLVYHTPSVVHLCEVLDQALPCEGGIST